MTGARHDPSWLTVERRDAPLILSIPHAGVDLLHYAPRFASEWLARRDADWHLPELYDFAAALGATIVRTSLSRSIIDVNRDPERRLALSRPGDDGALPDDDFRRRAALQARRGAGRRRDRRAAAGLFRALSRRARAPRSRGCAQCHRPRRALRRAFDPLAHPAPVRGRVAAVQPGDQQRRAPARRRLREKLAAVLAASGETHVVDGRFKGGWITRAFGRSAGGRRGRADGARLPRLYGEPERVGPGQLADAARSRARRRRRAARSSVVLANLARLRQRAPGTPT